ncbi:hypothetical protein GMLC_43560 [Geomonas limicola]|uniref:Lipoprotein n=1 Tax=Geomonas limicola TaxID=2740186 RepID=A0A6V8NG82_9BACT|nr:hypothetical protein [Geomonas limicola]GFO70777.1 hypothetical protein GMLC_43560 [Geomonas limicola]
MHGKVKKSFILLPLGALALAGCSGGSTSGGQQPVAGLTIASKVSVVDPKTGQAGKLTAKAVASLPAGSDFDKDIPFIYVNDRSIEAFNTPNDILCKVAQTRHSDMVNKGAYRALIDNKLCGDNGGQGGQAGNAPDYATWTVLATRADSNSPEVLRVWVHESHENGEKIIYGSANISAGASTANPLGLFRLDFAGYPATAGLPSSSQPVFKGSLLTEPANGGQVSLKFVEQDAGNGGGTSAAALLRSADGSTGSGTLSNSILGTMDIAYNTSLFHRVAGNDDRCLNRNDFDSSAWRYGLYDAGTGARMQRNSGFPISFTKNGVSGNGYVGYWGIWQNQGTPLANGDTVYKQSYGPTPDTTPYTVFTAPGKLVKHTRKTLTLAEIKGVALSLFSFTNNTPSSYRVTWDGSNFVKDALMVQGNNGQTWQDITPENIDLASLGSAGLNFYSDALGGDVQVKLACAPNSVQNQGPQTFACSASDTAQVVLYARSVVVPGDTVPSTLACTTNCPDLDKVANSDPFPYREVGFRAQAPSAGLLYSYAFNPNSLTLTQSGNPVVVSNAEVYPNGLQSGPLFDPSISDNIASLACGFDANATCGWQAWGNLAEFYTWETGPQSWQQFSTLKNGSTFLSFQQPLQVLYSHTGNGYTNAKFYLQYNGFGDLQGIPGKCIDSNTGADADCSLQGPNSSVRWVQQFTITSGSTVTDTSGNSYLVKPLELEQRMKATTGCEALQVSNVATPTLSIWADPGQPTEPVVTAAPAVIAGNLQ